MNLLPKLLLIFNLVHSISGINQDLKSRFIVNAKRNADKVSETTSSKIGKLRLILLGDVNNQNEIVRMEKRKLFCNELVDVFGSKKQEALKKYKDAQEEIEKSSKNFNFDQNLPSIHLF